MRKAKVLLPALAAPEARRCSLPPLAAEEASLQKSPKERRAGARGLLRPLLRETTGGAESFYLKEEREAQRERILLPPSEGRRSRVPREVGVVLPCIRVLSRGLSRHAREAAQLRGRETLRG